MLAKPPKRPGRPLPPHDPAALRRSRLLPDAAALGGLLRDERAARGLTQAEMALRGGMTRQAWSALERGRSGMGVGGALALLFDLGVQVMALPAAMDDPPGEGGIPTITKAD